MRPWVHLLCIVGGITAPIGLTLLTTSSGGARSAAHYAAIDQQAMSAREVMQAFEKLAFDEHKPVEAIERYFSPDFVDHDPDVKGDRASVIARMKTLNWDHGGPRRTIRHLIAEGDIVVIHHHLVRNPGERGIAAVDIFRVERGKIVEHWDVLQPVPERSINPAPMF